MPKSNKRKRWSADDKTRLQNTTNSENLDPLEKTVSEKKIRNAPQHKDATFEKTGNFIINLKQLQGGIFNAACCAQCGEGKLFIVEDGNEGWASQLSLHCTLCEAKTQFWTSAPLGKGKEINRKLTLGMRSIGRGHSAASSLAGFLDLPVSRGPWAKHTDALREKVSEIEDTVRFGAARRLKRHLIQHDCHTNHEVQQTDATKPDSYIDELQFDIAVSIDGSWKNRGFKSHHCVTTIISADTGEILDAEYLCNFCPECEKKKMLSVDEASLDHLTWVIAHLPKCPQNFVGSSQAMETEGVRRLYERSNETHLRYTTFIGDGDSKSYLAVKRMKPYGEGVEITKEECIGHVAKRMGTRLRRFRDKQSGKRLSDGKGIGGVGRLTLARIDSFQFFYRSAIISNQGDPVAARKEVMASLQHYAEGGDHSNCPAWCKRKDGGGRPVKHPLSPAIIEVIKPIFEDLGSLELLRHCSLCLTQNANESFHALLWSLAPKEKFNSAREIMLALQMARLYFNQGRFSANMTLLSSAGLSTSLRAKACFQKQDETRITKAGYTPPPEVEEVRRKVKAAKRSLGFKADPHYQSGQYHSGGAALVPNPESPES